MTGPEPSLPDPPAEGCCFQCGLAMRVWPGDLEETCSGCRYKPDWCPCGYCPDEWPAR